MTLLYMNAKMITFIEGSKYCDESKTLEKNHRGNEIIETTLQEHTGSISNKMPKKTWFCNIKSEVLYAIPKMQQKMRREILI